MMMLQKLSVLIRSIIKNSHRTIDLTYNINTLHHQHNNNHNLNHKHQQMDKDKSSISTSVSVTSSSSTLQQTLRKSRQVQQRYKKYMQQKQQSDKRWAQTQAKIDQTINKLHETKNVIKQIDQLYENYQKSFENAINSALKNIQNSSMIQIQDPEYKPKDINGKQFVNLLKNKKKVLIMTGAGISAASGIPTFRDIDGYWSKKKKQGVTPEEFLTLRKFQDDQFAIWDWLQQFYITKSKCKPNIGHVSIDQICNKIIKNKGEVCIVTQNIDNFHNQSTMMNGKDSKQKQETKLKACEKDKPVKVNDKLKEKNKQKQKEKQVVDKKITYPIYQVHGNILKVRCDNCSKDKPQMVCYNYQKFRQTIKSHKTPLCPSCQSPLRPHIMFFDQFYTQKYHHSDSVKQFTDKSDLLIVIGTALQTGLARNIVQNCISNKIDIVQINKQCTIRRKNVMWMQGSSEEILREIRKQFV